MLQEQKGIPMSNISEKNIARIAAIFILLIFTFSAAALWYNNSQHNNSKKMATIYQNGTALYTFDLSQITEPQEITITGENGAYNLILVEPGCISIKDASCPDHLCVHMGKITASALPITCLPNKVVISISDSTSQDIDSVAY